jgi:hypothetical protein
MKILSEGKRLRQKLQELQTEGGILVDLNKRGIVTHLGCGWRNIVQKIKIEAI